MRSPSVQTMGYLLVFSPWLILAFSWKVDQLYLLPSFFFLVLPFSRTVFGAASDQSADFTEAQATFLYRLPEVYALTVTPSVFLVAYALGHDTLTLSSTVWFTTSLLVAFALASCVAHALIHQPGRQRRLGSILSAVCAYPWLQYEHFAHHAAPRSTASGSAPKRPESALMFALRRLYLVPVVSCRFRHSAAGRAAIRHPLDCLYVHIGISLLTLLAFTALAGLTGFAVYFSAIALMPVLISLVNYMQHWSFGDDLQSHGKDVRNLSWDDDCQVLTWLTLDLNFHQNHHQNPHCAYFQRTGKYSGARMPFSYGFAIVIMLFPPLWRRLMTPRLVQWLERPDSVASSGKRLFCITHSSS